MTYVRCKIKNIAIPLFKNGDLEPPDYLEFVETLPNNTIRVKRVKDWCRVYCQECLDYVV